MIKKAKLVNVSDELDSEYSTTEIPDRILPIRANECVKRILNILIKSLYWLYSYSVYQTFL